MRNPFLRVRREGEERKCSLSGVLMSRGLTVHFAHERELTPSSLSLRAPDQRRHSPALPVTAMGEESRAVGERAPPATADLVDTERAEPAFRQRNQVRLPAAARVAL